MHWTETCCSLAVAEPVNFRVVAMCGYISILDYEENEMDKFSQGALNAGGQGNSRRSQTGQVVAGCFPLLFAALTGRSGHGLARVGRTRSAYPLGLLAVQARTLRRN